jgi:hypothetical protein
MTEMPAYPVLCYRPDCGEWASYKIAAQWSDGITHELKTYALSCPECLAELLKSARIRQKQCRRNLGETLGAAQVYERRGDRSLVRRADLE